MMSGYKAFFCVLLCAVCILFFFYRHYPGRAIADYIEQNVPAMAPGLDLDILSPGLCFPLGLHADTIQVSLKNQPELNPVQVKLNRVKSVLNIKPLWGRRLEISFSAGIWKGELTGLATIKDLGFDHVSIVSRFTGLDSEDILSVLNIGGLSCTGPVNGTIHAKITSGHVETWKADITANHIDLKWAEAIPVVEDPSFSMAMISCERTGQAPIRITACKIIGEQADIQLSGEISPAASFMKSRLNLVVKILAHPSQGMEDSQHPGHPNALSGINSIHFILTGTPENPRLKLTSLPNPLSHKHQAVARADKPPAQAKTASPAHTPKKAGPPSLDLKLLGTVTGSGIEPMAIIRKKGVKLERLYTLGETVDRAKILTITRRQVVLLIDGEQALLSMEDPDTTDDPSMASGTLPRNFFRKIALTKKDVNGMINNIDNLSGQIRIKRHSRGDQTDGYRISGLGKDSILYKKLGLRQGDIVTEINGQPIDSLDNLGTLYNQFIQDNLDSDIEIRIKRNGTLGVLNYRIK